MNRTEDKRPDSTGALSLKGKRFMTRTSTSRPRMAAAYVLGTAGARRWHSEGNVRAYRPPWSRLTPKNPGAAVAAPIVKANS